MKKKKPVVLSRKTTCCGGQHQTIAGAMLNSKEWKAWQKYNYLDPQFDVDETQEVGDMSDEHWQAFIKWIKSPQI